MKLKRFTRLGLGPALVVGLCLGQHAMSRIVAAQANAPMSVPVFEVDPNWPAKLPYNWIVGHVPSIAVDSRDHVFVLTRPNTLPPEDRARATPPVMELDASGKFVNGWGGHGIPGFAWPDSEHGIAIDYKNNVWMGGSAPVAPSLRKLNDDMLLKFDRSGKFLLQIGGRDKSPASQSPPAIGGNKDPHSVHQSADVFVYPKTNEAFVADGYGNRRVAVFDADTGAFKRMWGAFGNEPVDVLPAAAAAAPAATGRGAAGQAPPPGAGSGRGAALKLDTEGPGSPQFGSPVHGIKVSNDGLVYVADRSNRRVQVFTPEGKYVTQMFLNREGPASGSAAGVAFSPDSAQRFLYVADYGNSRIAVVERKTLRILYQFGRRSAKPGEFQGLHNIAVDSKGNIYTGEVAPGARMQRFVYRGMSSKLPPNALTPEELQRSPTSQQ
jgi:NHL repeat